MGEREVAIGKETDFDDRVGMAPLPDDREDESDHCDSEERDDEVALEPVFGLAAVEDDFEAREGHGDGENSPAIDFEFAAFPRGFDFFCELRRISQQIAGEDQRHDADRDIDEEDPAPAPVIGDPAAERRADGGRGDDGHAVEGEGCCALCGGESVDEDGLFDGSEAAATYSLEYAEEDEEAEAWRETAEEGADCEERDANHVIALAAKKAAEPRGKREHDGVGDEIAGEHPGAFVGADGEAAGDVWESDVGDGGVEEFHEGGEGDGDGDEPGIDEGLGLWRIEREAEGCWW